MLVKSRVNARAGTLITWWKALAGSMQQLPVSRAKHDNGSTERAASFSSNELKYKERRGRYYGW